MRNNKFLIPIVKRLRKEFLLGMLILCLGCLILALFMGWESLFPAVGSIGLSVFLARSYMQTVRHGRQGNAPLSLDRLAEWIDGSFESMLPSKCKEAELETYRYEMVYSVSETLTMGSRRNVGRMDVLIC